MTATLFYRIIDSPLGRLTVCGDGEFLTGLYLPEHRGWCGVGAAWRQADEPFRRACEQLAEYFAGERRQFELPLKPAGTAFQLLVWKELTRIPLGSTITYSELARRISNPAAVRAVGRTNGLNPISIIVPCHRVVGADGKLTGYAGGLEKKSWLLDLERRIVRGSEGERQLMCGDLQLSGV